MTLADRYVEQQEPPHNVEAEQALIGAALTHNEVLDAIADPLPASAFYLPVHGRIWAAILALVERGAVANPVTLREHFEGDKALADVGGARYLARLAGAAITVVNVGHYAELVRALAARRALLAAGEDIAREAREAEAGASVADLLADAESRLSEVGMTPGARKAARAVAAVAREVVAKAKTPEDQEPPLLTGLRSIDDRVRIAPGRYVVIAGRTSMGKSALALSLATRCVRTAARQGRNVGAAIFSLEMSDQECGGRMLADLAYNRDARITYEDIERGNVAPHALTRLDSAEIEMTGLPIWIDARPGLRPGEIAMAARRMKRVMARDGADLKLIVVDHLTLCRPDRVRHGGGKVEEVGEISGAMARLAKELGCCVMACVQVNRQAEQREDKRPTLADLRWSGDIEQDADVVAFLYRAEYYLERQRGNGLDPDIESRLQAVRNKAEVIIAKNRGGRTGTVELFCDIGCNHFVDLEYR